MQRSSDTIFLSNGKGNFFARGERYGRGVDLIGGTNIMNKTYSKGSFADGRKWKK